MPRQLLKKYTRNFLLLYLCFVFVFVNLTGCQTPVKERRVTNAPPVQKSPPPDVHQDYSQIEQEPFEEEEIPVQVEEEPEYHQNEFFVRLETEDEDPCWLISPSNCPNYEKKTDILLTAKIEMVKSEQDFTKEEEDQIDSILFSEYIKLLMNELNNIITNISECEGNIKICEEYRNQFVDDPKLFNVNEDFEYKKFHWVENNNDLYDCYVLALLTDNKHQQLIDRAIEYIRKKLPPKYVPQINPEVKWLE